MPNNQPPKTELPEPLAAAIRNATAAELMEMFKRVCERIDARRKLAPEQSGAESVYVAYIPPSGPQDGQMMFAGEMDMLFMGIVAGLNEMAPEAFQAAAEKGASHIMQQQAAAGNQARKP